MVVKELEASQTGRNIAQMQGKPPRVVDALWRYPVKGLSPERLVEVNVTPGQTLPFDRAYAIENGPGNFQPEAPRHLPKINFLMLMRNERLAALTTAFDDATQALTISRNGKVLALGRLNSDTGRAAIAEFFKQYMPEELRGEPNVVVSPGHSFSDVAEKCLHIINLASLRELQNACGCDLNPLRFRPNLIIDTETAWEEAGWLGKSLTIGDARLKVFKATERCAAINVNPETGARDQDLLSVLKRTQQHTNFGVYASVEQAGALKEGATVAIDA